MAAKKKAKRAALSRTLLFEIGVEELPAAFIESGKNMLAERAAEILKNEGQFTFETLAVYGTPRRLALSIEGLSDAPAKEEEILGPAWNVAYDSNNNPTAALKGFVSRFGDGAANVFQKETPKGVRVAIRVTKPRKKMAECLALIVAGLSFPKMMRWIGTDGVGLTFPRPLRWLVAFENNKPIRLKIGSVASGKFTYGHRFLSPKPVAVKNADAKAYKALLKARHVWIDEADRSAYIEKALTRLEARNLDCGLIETVSALVEEPFAVEGTFRKEYLELPAEVLATCMAKNQKIFICYDTKGGATNRFVAFLNGPRANVKAIVREYERVLEARLSDAALFYKEDMKIGLTAREGQIKQLAFLGKLGTMFDKSERLARLGKALLEGRPDAKALEGKLAEAAKLSKLDLATHMVYEFPELQGIMGAEYARKSGVAGDVADAIADHYWPKSLKDSLDPKKPIGTLGAWLGIADRLDTLVGAFGNGMEITGSQDPYALRRAAGGIVKIVHEMHRRNLGRFEFSLAEAVEHAHAGYGSLKLGVREVQDKMRQVIKERILAELLSGSSDARLKEILEGVLQTSVDNVLTSIERFNHLKQLYQKDRSTLARACKVVERTHNILKGTKQPVSDRVEDHLLGDGVERSLFDTFTRAEGRVMKCVEGHRYEEAARTYADQFYEVVHRYFDEVMVNAEDEAVRKNRQALMKKVNQLFTQHIADLSCVTQIGEP